MTLPDWRRYSKGPSNAQVSGRTEKPGDDAQVVWPVASQMTALSMLPVPTRLRGEIRDALCVLRVVVTSGRRMLMLRSARVSPLSALPVLTLPGHGY
jgi:hypothetical protein